MKPIKDLICPVSSPQYIAFSYRATITPQVKIMSFFSITIEIPIKIYKFMPQGFGNINPLDFIDDIRFELTNHLSNYIPSYRDAHPV